MTDEEKRIQDLAGAKSKVVTEETYDDFTPVVNNYTVKPFSAEQETKAYQEAGKTSAFGALMAERNNKLGDYAERYKKNAETAKVLAWSNLFTSLAKLGGWGAAPVIKSDNKPLMSALAEADKVRDLYDQTKYAYDTAGRQMRQSYVDAARATHAATEKAKYDAEQKKVDLANEAAMKSRNKTTTKYTYENDPLEALKRQKLNAEIASINARKDLSKAQKDKLIKEAEDKASGADKKPFYSYAGKDGYTYNLTKSLAQDIVTRLKQDKNNPPKGLDDDYIAKLNDDIALLETALEYGQTDAATLAIIAEYLDSNPQRFSDILNRTPREKTVLHEEVQPQKATTPDNNYVMKPSSFTFYED